MVLLTSSAYHDEQGNGMSYPPDHRPARNEIGERVEVYLPVRPSGRWEWVPGTITGLDPRGITVRFDYLTNGIPDCHATYDELRPIETGAPVFACSCGHTRPDDCLYERGEYGP